MHNDINYITQFSHSNLRCPLSPTSKEKQPKAHRKHEQTRNIQKRRWATQLDINDSPDVRVFTSLYTCSLIVGALPWLLMSLAPMLPVPASCARSRFAGRRVEGAGACRDLRALLALPALL